MSYFNSILGILTLVAFSLPCFAAEDNFSNYKAIYQLHWHGLLVGKSTHTVRRLEQNHLVVESHSLPNLSFIPFENYERSEFIYQNQRIQPLVYDFKTRDKKKKISGSLFFNWKHNTVEKKVKGEKKPNVFAMPKDVHDKITQIFQLQQDLIAGKKEFHFTVAEPKGVKIYDYTIIGKEVIKTPIGNFKTVILQHVAKDKDRRTRFWLAEEHSFLLIKLEQIKKGKVTAEALIKKLE